MQPRILRSTLPAIKTWLPAAAAHSFRDQRQAQDGPPTRDDWEMSFIGNMTGAVDTLFTYKPIVEKLQGLEGDEQVQAFARQWKQAVNLHLEETALKNGFNQRLG